MALVAHFEHLGVPICIPLDVVEMNFSHTGVALAVEFEAVLKSYDVSERVSEILCWKLYSGLTPCIDPWILRRQR